MADLIKALVDKNREGVIKRLPKYMSPEQFLQLCYWLDRDPKMVAVAQRNPDSLLNVILRAADCGLLIGTAYEHCWIVPYGNEFQLQIGWRGLVYQLLRAGAIIKATAACVYDGDEFSLELGDTEQLVHKPLLTDDRRNDPKWLFDKRNIQGAYAVAWLPTALKTHRWCPRGEIEAARLKSKVPDGPAWTHFYPAMASKTAVRRLCKLIEVCGPSAENQEAWERFGRTLELDRSQYQIHDSDQSHDDLPGVHSGKSSPKSGAAAEEAGTEHGTSVKTPPPPTEGRNNKRSDAPSPPPTRQAQPEPEGDEATTDEQPDELGDLARTAAMKTSALKKFVNELCQVSDPALLSRKQAVQVMGALKRQAK